jgi:flagellar hook-associated protein FlgK
LLTRAVFVERKKLKKALSVERSKRLRIKQAVDKIKRLVEEINKASRMIKRVRKSDEAYKELLDEIEEFEKGE